MRAITLLFLVLASVRLADAQRLDGVYVGWRASTMTGNVAEEYLAFYPDGRVYHDDPDEGMAHPLDWAEACRATQCGTYQLSGSTVAIRWRGGGEERFQVEPGGVLKREGSVRRFRPLAPLDGLRLDGIYAKKDTRGQVMVGITFSRAGEFREYNLLPSTSWAMRGGPERQRSMVGEGSGRYTIRRNTLELRYSNGLVTRHMISVPPGVAADGNAPTIYINRTRLEHAR